MDFVSEPDDPFIAGKNHAVNFADLACLSRSTNKIALARELVAKQHVLDLVQCAFLFF